ncbi:hypothetical protein [Halalkalibacter akibai]|uniref:Uncharacterized protein n=1 Tax=Halalkalibacter akibai (strain ATCC 43226 / DSM 21942 / CIP 109018 / JCM 9157 / 1139) TaxID=1236973 RepID=W4QVB9_HALA3|nr:hypothetical protein [Halalkalibacter akibai]GAE35284.1 hypothetical protein JCM9157_2385 [Halalkalibacter akibai JCM 9157]
MVNQDFEQFNKVQQQHKSPHLKGAKKPKLGEEHQNDSRNSGISVGAEGRDIYSKK